MTAISPMLWLTAQIMVPDSRYPRKMLAGPPLEREEPDPTAAAFGFGRRACPGRLIAESAIFITAAQILAVFDVGKALDGEGREIEVELEQTAGLLGRPKPFAYRIAARSEKHAELVRQMAARYEGDKDDAVVMEGMLSAE